MNLSRNRGLALALTLYLSRVIVSVAADNALLHDKDYDYDPPVPGSYALPVVKVAPDGAIIDSAGRSLNLRDLTHGRITVLSFIYTRCAAPKACPYATGVFSQLHALSADDKGLAKNMRLVSMSFDPDYDTPQHLAAYSEAMREEKLGCEWRFATARSHGELDFILNGYGQAVDKRSNPSDPQGPLYHILRIFLIDREGRIRNIYSSATLDPRLVLTDVKTLLLEGTKLSKQIVLGSIRVWRVGFGASPKRTLSIFHHRDHCDRREEMAICFVFSVSLRG